MKEVLGQSWYDGLQAEFSRDYMANIGRLLTKYPNIYPSGGLKSIFRAYTLCPLDAVKVVMLGMDPYHNEAADGLCFSTQKSKLPPSLLKLLQGVGMEFGEFRTNGDLSDWAKQGVLMLNSSLTVFPHQPGSCVNWGWHRFVGATLNLLGEDTMVLSYGTNAKQVLDECSYVGKVYQTVHPSYAARNGIPFKPGCRKANDFLISLGKKPIKWI